MRLYYGCNIGDSFNLYNMFHVCKWFGDVMCVYIYNKFTWIYVQPGCNLSILQHDSASQYPSSCIPHSPYCNTSSGCCLSRCYGAMLGCVRMCYMEYVVWGVYCYIRVIGTVCYISYINWCTSSNAS